MVVLIDTIFVKKGKYKQFEIEESIKKELSYKLEKIVLL